MALTKITPQMFDTSAAGHDFNIDNGTFVVDASANRVGIGTATPSTLLDVNGTATATTFVGALTGNVTGNLTGTILTAAQTNITSVGTLTSLAVTGQSDFRNTSNGAETDALILRNFSAGANTATALKFFPTQSTSRFASIVAENIDGNNNITLSFLTSAGNTPSAALILDQNQAATFSAGASFNGNINANDSQKVILGSGDDLEIYHDGSNNVINSANSHSLRIAVAGVNQWEFHPSSIFKGNDGKKIILGDSSDFQLYHDGSDSYITNATGALILNGSDVSIGSDHSGFSGWKVLNIRGASTGGLVNFENSSGTRSATFANQSPGMRYQTHISGGYHRFETEGTPNGYPLFIKNDGNVGMGTGAPKRMLQVGNNTQAIAAISLQSTTSGLSRVYMGDNDSTAAEYAGMISYAHSQDDMQFWTASTHRMKINDKGPVIGDNDLPGTFAYNVIVNKSSGGTSGAPYSSSHSGSATVSSQSAPMDYFKTVALINTRAYTGYVNVKTNLTANNIMFLAHFLGYNYNYGNKEMYAGGYTYTSNSILAKSNITVFGGNSSTVDSYRASDGALCFKLYMNHTGYTEGQTIFRFHSHSDTTTRQCTVVAVQIRNDGSNHFA